MKLSFCSAMGAPRLVTFVAPAWTTFPLVTGFATTVRGVRSPFRQKSSSAFDRDLELSLIKIPIDRQWLTRTQR
jgi:hypothetical protein